MRTYIIRAGESEYVKIGRAMSPEERLKTLQIAHYETLRVIRVVTGDAEKAFHRRFSSRRVRGEWFRFDPDMLTFSPRPEDAAGHDFDEVLERYREALSGKEAA